MRAPQKWAVVGTATVLGLSTAGAAALNLNDHAEAVTVGNSIGLDGVVTGHDAPTSTTGALDLSPDSADSPNESAVDSPDSADSAGSPG